VPDSWLSNILTAACRFESRLDGLFFGLKLAPISDESIELVEELEIVLQPLKGRKSVSATTRSIGYLSRRVRNVSLSFIVELATQLFATFDKRGNLACERFGTLPAGSDQLSSFDDLSFDAILLFD
jgi:hypothetical protein